MFFLKYILNYPIPTPSHWFLVHQVLKKCFDTRKGGILDVDMTVIKNYTSIWFMYLPLISLVFIWGNHRRWTERTNYKDTGVQWLRVWAQNPEWSGFIHGSMAYCLGELPAEPLFPLWNKYNIVYTCRIALQWSGMMLKSTQHNSWHVVGTQNMLVVFHSWVYDMGRQVLVCVYPWGAATLCEPASSISLSLWWKHFVFFGALLIAKLYDFTCLRTPF